MALFQQDTFCHLISVCDMDKNKELTAALLRGNKSLNIVPCSLKDGKSLIACQSGKKKVYSFYFKINFFIFN